MPPKNIFYAQSGGATAVINASACGVIETARRYTDRIGRVFAGRNGIVGALQEALVDTSLESEAAIAALRHTPGCAFGSCRYKLKSVQENEAHYRRLIDVFAAHDIGYFFYNGGNDSQDTAHKVAQVSQQWGYPLVCLGIPKTVDNDLPFTDNCPGFASAAKYVAISTLEAALDLEAMCSTSTQVFIMEVMGRHAGWLAAASGLCAQVNLGGVRTTPAPQIILFPEVSFDLEKFLERVQKTVAEAGFCVIVASEGIRNAAGKFLCEAQGGADVFGHAKLGGVAPLLAGWVKQHLGLKYHWALLDYLQRSACHIASATDVEQAYALGKAAVEMALSGEHNKMLTLERQPGGVYRWVIGAVALEKVANVERKMPRAFISADGFGITQACVDYLLPLIEGEAYPAYHQGLPQYARLQNKLLPKKLPLF